jgi:hypothetical protein
VGYVVLDPTKIKNAKYRVTFEDTVASGGAAAPDTFKTKNFTIADITNLPAIDTLVARSIAFTDSIYLPVIDGFKLVLKNESKVSLNSALSSWNRKSVYSFQFQLWQSGFIFGLPKPSDYEIIFGPVGTDTSTSSQIVAGYTPPAIPVDFKVINTSDNKQIKFAFAELDNTGGPGVFSVSYDPLKPGGTKSDFIVFLEKNLRDSLVITWGFSMLYDSTKSEPTTGDTAKISLYKMFQANDIFEFSTQQQKIDVTQAKTDLDKIKVVPNPYIAVATWEPRNPYNTGRGSRSIHFNHLPQACTIRIYNVAGELVATIDHNSPMLDGTEEWNLLTRDNLTVAYGVYIFQVDAPGIGVKIGKFAVIK